MTDAFRWGKHFRSVILAAALLAGLYVTSLVNFPLVHSLAEGFSIVVGFSIFLFAWNSRRFLKTDYFLFLGVAYLAVAAIDALHTLAYKGMGVFPGHDADLPTQLWLAARFVQSGALLVAPFFLRRRFPVRAGMALFGAITAAFVALIFGGVFPAAYVEGEGLTAFKRLSELAIVLALLGAGWTHLRRREVFTPEVFALIIGSIALTIASELSFVIYLSVYDAVNLFGHFLKLIAFYLLYKAVLQTGLVRPFDLLFRDLEEAQRRYRLYFQNTLNPLAIFEVASDGSREVFRFIEGNQALIRLLAIDPATSVGKLVSELSPALNGPMLREQLLAARAQKREQRVEHLSPDGERVFTVAVFPVGASEVGMVLEDITERRMIEALEREQRQLAEALRNIANALNSALALPEVFDSVLSNLARVIPHDLADILLIDAESGDAGVVGRRSGDAVLHPDLDDRALVIAETPHLRALMGTREPLIVDDIQIETGLRLSHNVTWRGFLGAPIVLEDQVIGFIELGSRQPGFFTPKHAARLEAFAEQVAIAIHNARLLDRERALIAAQERERLARDLHDAVSQTLFSASMIAESLPRQWNRSPEKALEQLAELHQLTRGAMAEMRVLLLELRPTSLLEVDLPSLLRQLAEAIRSRKRMAIQLEIDGDFELDPEIKLALYRITQEALNNIAKHAHATQAAIHLEHSAQGIALTISDNGAGFKLDDVQATSLGLEIMRERSEEIGAELTVTSQPGNGTCVQLFLKHALIGSPLRSRRLGSALGTG